MLTGCRLTEIQKVRREHVDLEAFELRLPDTRTGGDNPRAVTGRMPGLHLTDLQHPWRRIRVPAEPSGVRIHDLRHSFASRTLALGEAPPIIGRLLGHRRVETTARYAHLARDPVREADERIAVSIAADIL